MAVRSWPGEIIDEQEHTYLLQWGQADFASRNALKPSWVPKVLVVQQVIDKWEQSRAFRWRRSQGHFQPWAPPRGSDPTSPASTASSSATDSPRARRDPGDFATPKRPKAVVETPEAGPSGSSPKRVKLEIADDETVSVESIALRLAFDSCVKRIIQILTNLHEERNRLSRAGSSIETVEGKGKKPLDGPGSSLLIESTTVASMAQIRLAASELTSLVAQGSKDEQNDPSDLEYGERAKRQVLQKASNLDKGVYEELKRILYPR